MATMACGMNMVRWPAFDLGGPKTLRPPVPRTSASATASRPASRSSRPTRRPATSDQRRPRTAPSQIMGRYSSGTWAAMPATSSGVRSKRRVPSTGGRLTLRHGFRANQSLRTA